MLAQTITYAQVVNIWTGAEGRFEPYGYKCVARML